jgi:hypothetical protein
MNHGRNNTMQRRKPEYIYEANSFPELGQQSKPLPRFGDVTPPRSVSPLLNTSSIQGVPMYTSPAAEKPVTATAASSSSSPVAPAPIASTNDAPATATTTAPASTVTEDSLIKAEQELAYYIYLQKGLTTNGQTSQVSQYASYIPGASFLGAKPAVSTRYHMLDDVLMGNLKHYQNYVQALQETNSDDSGSQQTFFAKLKALDESLTPRLTPKTRFATLISNLYQQFLLASKSDNKDLLKTFINCAKAQHAVSPLPVGTVNNDTLSTYIRKGPRTLLSDAVYEKTKTQKLTYKELKDTECTQLDAQLMMSLVMLHEQSCRINPPALDVLHVFHQSLNMLKLIRQKAGMPDTLAAEEKNIDAEKARLKDYRNPQNGFENAKQLMTICKEIPEKCNKLSGPVAAHAANTPELRYFDSALATQYLKALDAYAQTATIVSKIDGLQAGITNTQGVDSSQKKTHRQ